MRRFYVRRPRTPSLLPYARGAGAGCPSIRAKALSRTNLSWRCVSTARCAREGEDQDSGNLTRNHFAVELRSTNHRFGHDLGHDSSMRTSRRVRDARAPNQRFDLARADPGHRAGKGQINERPTRKPKPKRRSWVTIKRFNDAPFNAHGNGVFTNGKNFITADRDFHSGGYWKLFDSSGTRLGTYNEDSSTRIGP